MRIWDKRLHIQHSIRYNEKTRLPYWYHVAHYTVRGSEADRLYKYLLQELLSTGQFILKETALRSGTDILVNEQPDYFIIAHFGLGGGRIDNPGPFQFHCYEK